MWPYPLPYGLHAQSPCVDQLRDLCHHHSYYPHVGCSYCQSFDHDMNYCPIMIFPMNHMLKVMP